MPGLGTGSSESSSLERGGCKIIADHRDVDSRFPLSFCPHVLNLGLFSFRIILSCGTIFGKWTMSEGCTGKDLSWDRFGIIFVTISDLFSLSLQALRDELEENKVGTKLLRLHSFTTN